MKTFTIIAPHIDDDIFSCASVLELIADTEDVFLRVLYLSYGQRQLARKKVIESIYEKIFKIMGNKYEVHFLDLFEDGKASFSNLNAAVSRLDYFVEISTYLFTTGYSHHQDHLITSTLVNAALRFRNTLKSLKGVFQYEYMYNHDNIPSEMFLPLSAQGMENKINSLKELNAVDTILDHQSVNSLEYIKSMATINGLRSNYPYAESFKVIYLKSGTEGVNL